jgi:N-acetylmuramoyl-L-alanine amidase
MTRRWLLLGLFVLLAAGPASAASLYERLEFRGQTLSPRLQSLQGKAVWALDDPEIVRLIELSAARLQWSSSGQTLYVYTAHRQTSWTPGSPRISSDGADMTAPGMLWGSGSQAAIEPAALLYALGLRAFPSQTGGARLLPLVGGARLVTTEQDRRLLLAATCPLHPQVSRPSPRTLRLTLPEAVWEGEQGEMALEELRLKIQGGSGPGQDLVIDITFPDNWKGELVSDTLLTQIAVQCLPDFPVAMQGAPTCLERAEFQRSGQEEMLILYSDGPFQFFWSYDPASHNLSVEVPRAYQKTLAPLLESPESGLLSARFRNLPGPYPVLRLEARLAEGRAFQFFQMEGVPNSLVLHIAPQGSMQGALPVGSASVGGPAWRGGGLIVIDAGHGGSDPGCINHALGAMEKDITLDVALRLRDLLTSQGWTVVLTRETDTDLTPPSAPARDELQARCDVANRISADLFVSLHCNASVSQAPQGTSIHWYKAEDYQLAQYMETILGSLGIRQLGLRQNRFYVLRHTTCPAVLVEMAFLTNPEDGARLCQPEFRQKIAEQLALGLGAYVAGRQGATAGAPPAPVQELAPDQGLAEP